MKAIQKETIYITKTPLSYFLIENTIDVFSNYFWQSKKLYIMANKHFLKVSWFRNNIYIYIERFERGQNHHYFF